MSSEGPKMRGGRYGSAWNGRKTSKSDDPPWRPPPRFSSLIWERPAVVCHETWPAGSYGGGAPPWPALIARGWPVTPPTTKTRLV